MKYALVGASGRMGGEIQRIFAAHELCYTLDVTGETSEGVPEVLIDFSQPSALGTTIAVAGRYSCSLVLGTTGLSEAQLEEVKDLGRSVPVVQSFNFAAGVTLFKMILGNSDHFFRTGTWRSARRTTTKRRTPLRGLRSFSGMPWEGIARHIHFGLAEYPETTPSYSPAREKCSHSPTGPYPEASSRTAPSGRLNLPPLHSPASTLSRRFSHADGIHHKAH